MWPFRKRKEPVDQPLDTESYRLHDQQQQIEDLKDDIAHLNRRFARLQQQVTRWARDYDEQLDVEEDDVEDDFDRILREKRESRG